MPRGAEDRARAGGAGSASTPSPKRSNAARHHEASHATTAAAIRSATTKLLAGGTKVAYKLTAVALAREAGVARSTLYRHRDLVDDFERRVADLRRDEEAKHPAVEAERLRAELATLAREYRAEIVRLELALKTALQQVNYLMIERDLATRKQAGESTMILPISTAKRRAP